MFLEEYIPQSKDLDELKVRACISRSGNASPRADEISVKLLLVFWKDVGPHI